MSFNYRFLGEFFDDVYVGSCFSLSAENNYSNSDGVIKRQSKKKASDFVTRRVDWNAFEKALIESIGVRDVNNLPLKVRQEIDTEKHVQKEKLDKIIRKERMSKLNVSGPRN